MPLGFERLNERTQRPNANINFIRTLPGPTSPTAEAILSRVAAQCYPFMKAHTILVQALEEFPYNTEFVGRNFNAGEVIQLVLRNKQGQWLPERWVAMVMVHELAHCKQMNHSKAFWKVRDEYAGELRGLWRKGYTGEGMWGRGRELETGGLCVGSTAVGDVPEHLCGGTYARGKRRRRGGKVKEELSNAEKKQRRILKKFGAGGQALGADDDTKVKLEGGVAKKGKPRVAGSARGRELRAAAALARFAPVKKEEEVTVKDEPTSDSETEDEEEYARRLADGAAIDVDGKKMLDDKGRALVKVCADEDGEDENVKREMEEFDDIDLYAIPAATPKPSKMIKTEMEEFDDIDLFSKPAAPPKPSMKINIKPAATNNKVTSASAKNEPTSKPSAPTRPEPTKAPSSGRVIHLDELYKRRPESTSPKPSSKPPQNVRKAPVSCPVCSLINEPGSLTCIACSNVLNPALVPNNWRCRNTSCKGSEYINAGDAGVCGLCGTSRTAS